MVNFRALAPMDLEMRANRVPLVKNLLNGSHFKFHSFIADGRIRGRYVDYTGEWCDQLWTNDGKFPDRSFPEFDLDWGSAR